MDATDRALLEETVRDALAAGPDDGDAVLADLGWHDLLAAEPRVAVEVVFDALGRTHRSAGVLDDVVVAALGWEPHEDLAVVLPRFGTWAAPGTEAGGAEGLATRRLATASEVLVVARDGATALVLPRAAVDAGPVRGIDPEGGYRRVSAECRTGGRADALPDGAWSDAVAAAQRALAHQVAGACRTMLDLARAHAVERVQFGRTIARFQAVRHRLAEALVALEGLDAAVDAAWDEDGGLGSALAKAAAARTARAVAAHCQQVLAGIGFTTDHPFHRYLKRTMVLEGLFGSADEILVAVGRDLLADRAVPRLVEL